MIIFPKEWVTKEKRKKIDKEYDKVLKETYKKVEKAFKAQNWPTESYVSGKRFNLTELLVYDPEVEYASISDLYKNHYWDGDSRTRVETLTKVKRDERGIVSKGEEFYVLPFNNEEELRKVKVRIVTDGPFADYYQLREAYGKLREAASYRSSLNTANYLGVIFNDTPKNVFVYRYINDELTKNNTIVYKDGSPFMGDEIDLTIATIQYNTTLKDICDSITESVSIKKSIEKEAEKVLNTLGISDNSTDKLYDSL